MRDYSILESLYDIQDVENQKVYAKMYSQRNRYVDIITYNKSRVQLTTGVDLKVKPEGDYINACYVNSPFPLEDGMGDRKIIASQGPLAETMDHFWQMVVENNVTMIVSTCRLTENGRSKCARFWPKDEPQKFLVTQNDKSPVYAEVRLVNHAQVSSFLETRLM